MDKLKGLSIEELNESRFDSALQYYPLPNPLPREGILHASRLNSSTNQNTFTPTPILHQSP